MRAGLEGIWIAEALHDIGFSSLRAGDDAGFSEAGASGSLPVDNHILVEVILPASVVVRDVNHRLELRVRVNITDNLADALHHQTAVAEGEFHAVVHLVPVVVRLVGLHWQEGHIDVRIHRGEPAFVLDLRFLIVVHTNLRTKVTRAGVNHNPQKAVGIPLEFQEVVASAHCSNLLRRRNILALYDGQFVDVEALWHISLVLGCLVVVETEGNPLPDAAQDLLSEHFARDVFNAERCLHCAHSTSDVDADRIGNHHPFGGQHTADRHTLPSMHIRHKRQMMENEWQSGEIHDLLHSVRIHALCPNLHGHIVQFNLVHSINVFVSECKVKPIVRRLSAQRQKFSLFL